MPGPHQINNKNMIEGILYKVGEKVRISGLYVCVPCGYKKKLEVGNTFPPCEGCMRISRPVSDTEIQEAAERGEEIDEFDKEAFAPNLETWELVKEE